MAQSTVEQIKAIVDKDRKPIADKVEQLEADLKAAKKELADYDKAIAKDLSKYLSGASVPVTPKTGTVKGSGKKPKYTDDQWREALTTVLTDNPTLNLDELYGLAKDKLKVSGRGNFKNTVERIVKSDDRFSMEGDSISLAGAAA